jgi:hypothetical protein
MGKAVAVAYWREGQKKLTIEERVQQHLEDGTASQHICLNAWALRHQLRNKKMGEMVRFRCGLWSCAHCGPRKVDQWRQVIAEADPKLHLVLTKAGHTVEEAARHLTTFMQALRRGSKGRGKSRKDARPAYPVEYLAVLEEHKDFERNGFHWHILISGLEYLPHEILRDLWISATHGQASIVYITRVSKKRAIGYVVKYLMKDIFKERKGVKRVKREKVVGLVRDENGDLVRGEDGRLLEDRLAVIEEVESKARRIRYSRNFFPEPTKAIRKRLFTPAESTQDGQEGEMAGVDTVQSDEQEEQGESEWELVEVAPPVQTAEEYQERVRSTLAWAVRDYVDTGKRLSMRVLRMWDFHRSMNTQQQDEPISGQLRRKWLYQLVGVTRPDGQVVKGVVTGVSLYGDITITLPDDEEGKEQPTLFFPVHGGDQVQRSRVVLQLLGLSR